VLRTRGDQFRYQTGLRASGAPEDTLTLKQGEAYLLSTRGDLQRVIIPQMTHADMLRLGTLIDAPARSPAKFGFTPSTAPLTPLVANCKPDGSQMVANHNQATTATDALKPHHQKRHVRRGCFWRVNRLLRSYKSCAV
jgi:hypothetical protein